MSIPRETIEQIRDRSRIEEIVKNYVPTLQKRGRNYIGLCPFHKEKTPSFTVSPEKQIFYCFGCHTGGNVFSFISKMERLNFPESVRFLGNLAGIQVHEDRKDEGAEKREYLLKINRYAMNLYHKCLKSDESKGAMEYALGRGLSEESIDAFMVGYAPDSWDFLIRHLQKRKISLPNASEAALIIPSKNREGGGFYDRFRGRLMFPIFNLSGDVIAFGGRILGSGEPKYLNSPEYELFSKSAVLYGLNTAREHIIDLQRAIVVEGYLDVIGCHQNGIRNVVAPLGTALTEQQVTVLSRYCKEIVLLFDADSAGIKASLRSLDIVDTKNVDVRVAMLPDGDPFEYITEKGARQFMAVVDSSIGPVDFKISRVLAESRNFDALKKLFLLFDVIKDVRYETERNRYLKKISTMLNLDEHSVLSDYEKFSRGLREPKHYTAEPEKPAGKDSYLVRSYRELVGLILLYPEMTEQAVIDFSAEEITDPVTKNVFTMITSLYSEGKTISVDSMFDYFPSGDENRFLETILAKNFESINYKDAYTEIYINIKLYNINNKIERYVELIRNSQDSDTREYLTEVEVLRRDKEKLLSYIHNRH
ncbi:MAG TPA: DNA primase [Spirochaetota bacterium]|nr:DNA primase [Spirochaetota bacterium]